MTQTLFARPAMILAASVAMFTSLPATAQESGNTDLTQAAVHFSDAELANASGVASVRARIVRAARTACKPVGSTSGELAHSRACFAHAVAQGNARVDTLLARQEHARTATLAASGR
jgi:UrcA family protein